MSAAAFRAAVLVRTPMGADQVDASNWRLLHADSEIAKAREAAAEYVRANPDEVAHVMVHDDTAAAEMTVKWSKP